MTDNSTVERRDLEPVLVAMLRDDLHVEVPSADTDLFNTGLLDSLKIVELLVSLETHLGVHFELADLEIDSFRTVRAIAEFVRGAVAQSAHTKVPPS